MPINNIISIKSNNSEIFAGDGVFNILKEYLRPYQGNKIFLLVDENTLKYCISELIINVNALEDAEIIEINSGDKIGKRCLY